MSGIAVQCAVGPVGGKATTTLSTSFSSLVNTEGFQYGANSNGIYQLNSTSGTHERTMTLATTDLGISNPKRARFLNIGVDADSTFTLSIKIDEQSWRSYYVSPHKTGLQRIRVPIGRDGQGRYWTIKITSTANFRIEQIDGTFVVRSTGIVGY